MSLIAVHLAEETVTKLPIEAWAFGLIALCVFAALGFVTFTYRDVANRHAHKAAPDAAAHAGAPGASHLGNATGHGH